MPLTAMMPDRALFVLRAPDDGIGRADWGDFDAEPLTMAARVTDVNVTGSDPTIQVRAEDGLNWTIDLTGRSRIRDAGLTPRDIGPGDDIVVLGHRSHHFGESRIRALRLSTGGRDFDLHPEALAEA
ncbi:hypothetical protein MLD63_12890 [Paracoccus sp. TK19116]|uniref:FHA domain-containing protein n=1 Tax=Paracoccus albicereus TaxID=2922394 RepID=A0ABT1MSM3_9RHOB|nr:hypothetical protein [Paracoccus albicereus]MCQ0971320.1 hypothetical protein [Paracoccus albicereus]